MASISIRLRFTYEALKLGFNLFISDVDVYFYQNPFPYLEQGSWDLQIQWDAVAERAERGC